MVRIMDLVERDLKDDKMVKIVRHVGLMLRKPVGDCTVFFVHTRKDDPIVL